MSSVDSSSRIVTVFLQRNETNPNESAKSNYIHMGILCRERKTMTDTISLNCLVIPCASESISKHSIIVH
ncbi:14150_t:CDS:1, partial [Rhizophagus irregularis]